MKLAALAVALIGLLPAPAAAQEEESWDARLGAVSGEVVVRPADGSEEVAAEADMPLEVGDRVVVPEGASAEVSLDGGSLITLRPGSELVIERTAKADSSLLLELGSLLAKIQKLAAARFQVRTPTAVAAVRGTEFGVEVEGEGTHVGVFDEGKVEVTSTAGGSETLISNQETSVLRGAAPIRAVQLRRFARHRALMRRHGRRIAAIRARWRAIPRARRLEMRRQAFERLREHRRQRIERRQRQGREELRRRREGVQEQRQRVLENRRKLEERRQRVRQRGQGRRP